MAAKDLVQRRVVERLGCRAGRDDRAKLAPVALGVEPLADRFAHRVSTSLPTSNHQGPAVNRETVRQLDGINREFYSARAEEFLATRAAPWPGWKRLLPHLNSVSASAARLRILDVGCGNGRLGAWLDDHLGRAHRYVGLDRSLSLLARPAGPASRILADLVASRGRIPGRDAAFDVVLALALFHHLPSLDLRRSLLDDLVRLLRPQGLLVLSFWQFAIEQRFERRMVPVEAYNRAASSPIDPAQLEPGDFLLRWGDQENAKAAIRYCHFTSAEEAGALIEGFPRRSSRRFAPTVAKADLNSYLVARKS